MSAPKRTIKTLNIKSFHKIDNNSKSYTMGEIADRVEAMLIKSGMFEKRENIKINISDSKDDIIYITASSKENSNLVAIEVYAPHTNH